MTTWSSEELRGAVAGTAQSILLPDPLFDFSIGWSPDYEGLFSRTYTEETTIAVLRERAHLHGRVLLHGEAGSGKTTILSSIFKQVAEGGGFVAAIDLRRWTPPMDAEWSNLNDNQILRGNFLLTRLGDPAVDDTAFRALGDGEILILVDGLNEIRSQIAAQVLTALDSLARRETHLGIVVADRLTRRDLPSRHWAIAAVQPLSDEMIESVGGDYANELLRRPFFLDLEAQGRLTSQSSAGAIRTFIEEKVRLDARSFDLAATAAYAMYAESSTRTFPYDRFVQEATEPVAKELLKAGLLRVDGDQGFFDHHLFHDYLAAHWFATHEAMWTREAFDTLSFHASAFDSLALAVEEVGDQSRADELIRRIYDWNFYASAYALAKGRQEQSIAVSEGMEIALLANLAERRWDPIARTAQAVTDALRVIPTPIAQRFLEVDSFETLQNEVSMAAPAVSDDEFQQWRELFVIPAGTAVRDQLVELLKEERSLLGWTAANVLRRAALTPDQEAEVRSILRHGEQVVRWRAGHTLGANASEENATALLTSLTDDPDEWVRYGVIRALIEEATADPALGKSIMERVGALATQIREQPLTLYEFSRALLLRHAPTTWPDVVAPALDEFLASAPTVQEQDRWRLIAYEIERARTRELA